MTAHGLGRSEPNGRGMRPRESGPRRGRPVGGRTPIVHARRQAAVGQAAQDPVRDLRVGEDGHDRELPAAARTEERASSKIRRRSRAQFAREGDGAATHSSAPPAPAPVRAP